MVAGEAVLGEAAEPPPRTPGALAREEVHAAFVAAMREGMASTGLKQWELAGRVGVSAGRVSQFLNYSDKLPARWARIVELLAAADASVDEFANQYGSFWPDCPAPVAEPTDAAADDTRNREQATPITPPAAAAGQLDVPTMADANAASTGLVLSTPVTDEPGSLPAPQLPVETSLEAATELAMPRVHQEKVLVIRDGSDGPLTPRPPQVESLDGAEPPASTEPSQPDSGSFLEDVFVEEDPTGPVSVVAEARISRWFREPAKRRLSLTLAAGLALTLIGMFVAFSSDPDDNTGSASVAPASAPLILGVVDGAGPQGLTERTFPSKGNQSRTLRSLPDGTPVAIDCAAVGDPVSNEAMTGTSTTWLRLKDNYWVTSVFVRVTGASSVASCSGGPALTLALTPR